MVPTPLSRLIEFFLSIPVWGWADVAFTLMVLIGVWGESDSAAKFLIRDRINDLLPIEFKKKRLIIWSQRILIFGLAGELACLAIGLNESAELNRKAAEFSERAKQLESTNLVLAAKASELEKQAAEAKIQLAELQANVRWREITPKQKAEIARVLIFFGPDFKKDTVEVGCQGIDLEALGLAKQMVEVLTACKFNVEPHFDLDLSISTVAGIFVIVKTAEAVPTRAFIISQAFNNAGLTTQITTHPDFSENQVRVWIGAKPPPK